MNINEQSARGQIIIVFILAIVGVIGAAALAVDGGNFYLERRNVQDAVDSSAWAAARAKCLGEDIEAAAGVESGGSGE